MVLGVAGMLIGAIDPLEGSIIILPASALVALGGFLAKVDIESSSIGL
jgi:hypothetical protein